MTVKPSVLITGASTGIGAAYAERFARRDHNLVLVARNTSRLKDLAKRLRGQTGVAVDILAADLVSPAERAVVEARLRDDTTIGILINNAGTSLSGTFLDHAVEDIDRLVSLNTTALLRLAHAIAPRLARAGDGAIVNIGSAVGLAPEYGMPVYGATKAFVLHLSQALNVQLGSRGVYVQAVLPAATRTEIWSHAGVDVNSLPALMEVNDLVDAALAGFDKREAVTIPPLHDLGQWKTFEAARQAMTSGFGQSRPAERYHVGAAA